MVEEIKILTLQGVGNMDEIHYNPHNYYYVILDFGFTAFTEDFNRKNVSFLVNQANSTPSESS